MPRALAAKSVPGDWDWLDLETCGGSGISNIQLIFSPVTESIFPPVYGFECFLFALKHPKLLQTTAWLVSQNSQSLLIHSKTCFASFIKLQGCQLHLQVYFTLVHWVLTLYLAHLNSINWTCFPDFIVTLHLTIAICLTASFVSICLKRLLIVTLKTAKH